MLKIVLSVLGGLALILIVWGIIAYSREKKKEKKLDENIKKLKEEKEAINQSVGKLSLAEDEKVEIEPLKLENPSNPVEQDNKKHLEETPTVDDDKELEEFFKQFEDDFEARPIRRKRKSKSEDYEFEKFLDKHSYTRKILDKDILKKIQNLPPDVKAVVISNIFTRPQD